MTMRGYLAVLWACCILFTALAGCLSEDGESNSIQLDVNFPTSNGTIAEFYIDGELESRVNPVLDFDFSNTKSEYTVVTLGIDSTGDGISVVPTEVSDIISLEFLQHGIFYLDAFAIDELGNRVNQTIVIRIELNIHWIEETTYSPKSLEIDSLPKNGGPYPSNIIIDSNVENPELIENIGGGREVEITWYLFDETEHACLVRPITVDEGEIANWKVNHRITSEIHDLTISYDSGQDYIDIEQSISILYQEVESPPNP